MTGALAAPAEMSGVGWNRRPLALGALCTILFLTFLDNTIVAVALASIRNDLGAGVFALQWVIGAYAMTFAALMLGFGMLGDEFGRKKVMLTGAAVYCGGAVLSALAPSVSVLIAGRAVMGFGAAASEPGTLSMVRQLYAEERSRNRALGVWAAVSGFSLALGPVLGGTLVGLWSWRGIFWFDVTFGLAAMLVSAIVLPESADPRAGRVDKTGTALGAIALASMVFAILNGENAGFLAPKILALYGVSVAAGIAFLFWERRTEHPLLDLRFFRVTRFTTPNLVAFCCYFATFAIFIFSALYLVVVAGYSGYKIAAVFLPMTVLTIAASLIAGRLITIVGVRWSLVFGCVLFAAGLLATNATLSPHASYPLLAASLGLAGIGLGACVVPVTSSVLDAVPGERSGMAASATNTSREFGAVVGVVVLGALVNAQLKSGLIVKMMQLHEPASLQSFIISSLETGGGATVLAGTGGGSQSGLVGELFKAGYAAFAVALHKALYLSTALLVVAALLSLITLRRSRTADAVVSD